MARGIQKVSVPRSSEVCPGQGCLASSREPYEELMRTRSDTHMQGTHGEDVAGRRGPSAGRSHTCAHAITFPSVCDCLLQAQGVGPEP